MATLKEKVEDFLAQDRIAVAGVSRTRQDAANLIYRKLKASGHQVFPINPKAQTVEGDPCYPDLKSIPGGVDGVVIVTRPEVAEAIARECAEVGVPRVWMHRSMEFIGGSVSQAAVQICAENDIEVIAGACPMMYSEPVDFGHRCMRWFLGMTGRLPN